MTIKESSDNYNGIQHSGTLVYEDCTIEGVLWLYAEKATFKNCTFKVNADNYNVWVYDRGTILFDNCEFINEKLNKSLLIYNEGAQTYDVTVKDCKFKAAALTKNKAAIQMHTERGISGKLTIINSTAENFFDQSGRGTLWSEVNNSTDPETPTCKFNVTVDGKTVQVAGMTKVEGYNNLYIDGDGNYALLNLESLKDWYNFLNKAKSSNPYNKTFKLYNDIDASGYTWNSLNVIPDATTFVGLVFDGNGKTISNLTIAGEGMFNMASAGSIVKNLTIDGAVSTSESHNAAIFWGSVYSKVNFENVIVKNSTVTGNCNAGIFVGGTYEPNDLVVSFKDCHVENCAVTANGYEGQDPTGASGFLGKAYANSKVVFSGENSIDEATVITNKNSLVGGKVYGYTTWVNGGWAQTGACDSFQNWAGIAKIVEPESVDDIRTEGVDAGTIVVLPNDIEGAAAKGGYKKAGVTVNGGILDGNGNDIVINDANGTWDCAVYCSGGTIKNLKIGGAFRGIFTAGCSSDIIIDNVTIDNVCYTISSDGSNPNYSIIVTNSTFNGWTSYTDGYKSVSFTNCKFGQGTGDYTYAYCRPYDPTEFVGCEFEAGYTMDPRANISFENCTIGGVAITNENVAEFVTDVTKVTIK